MAGLFCKRFSKNFIFILKLALANYQPILALLHKRLCNILNKSLLYSLFLPNIHHQHRFYKRFLQHVALFSSIIAFFLPIFNLNTVSARDFCNMLHFSLLNLPFSSQHSPSTQFCKRFLQHTAFFSSKLAFFFLIFTLSTVFTRDFCNMLHFSLLNSPRSANLTAKNAKAPGAGQACFRGNHDKFYFAFGPRPYFFR